MCFHFFSESQIFQMFWGWLEHIKKCRNVNSTNCGRRVVVPLRSSVKRELAVRDRISWQPPPVASSGFTQIFMSSYTVSLAAPTELENTMGAGDSGHFCPVWTPQTGSHCCELAKTFSVLPCGMRFLLPVLLAYLTVFTSISYAKRSEGFPYLSLLLELFMIGGHFPQRIFFFFNSALASASQKTQTDTLLIWNFSLIIIQECSLSY